MHGFIFYKIIRKLECFHRRKVSVHLKQNRNGGRGGGLHTSSTYSSCVACVWKLKKKLLWYLNVSR